MPSMPPATAAVRRAVRQCLSEAISQGHLSGGDLVAVACSGGADSLALAAATAFEAPRLDLRAGSISVDHGMQHGSEQVAATATQQCADLGLDPALTLGPRDCEEQPVLRGEGQGPEGTARALRYAAFDHAATRHNIAMILLGHTLNDQAETVLLALGRGSGARALAGMAPRRGRYLRPLLGITRTQTEAACAQANLTPWHDPSNQADGPWRQADGAALPRAAVREHALPALADALGPGVPQALARTAEQVRADADYLDRLATELLAKVSVAEPEAGDVVVLDAEELARAARPVRTRALAQAALAAGATAGALGHTHIEALDGLVMKWRGQGPIHLPGMVHATRRCGNLVLSSSTTTEE